MDSEQPASLSTELLSALDQLTPIAKAARNILVLTGAGVSAESGVPTFRDAQTGLWAKYDPVMLASYEGFCNDPETVWKWYDMRREKIAQVRPNQGHYALAEWEQAVWAQGNTFQLATQNIDDLHGIAGSQEMIELHGNIWLVRPLDGPLDSAFRLAESPLTKLPPQDKQGRMLRPHVVWFGEMLDPAKLEAAFAAANNCDLALSCGTSSLVHPAAALPYAAKRGGAVVVEVNPNPTELSASADFVLEGPSGLVLPELVKRVLG